MAQVLNPIIASTIATQNRGVGHFTLVHAQALGIMGLGKYAGERLKLPMGKRPDSYSHTGMPSGHTTSAWSAASYVRLNGGDYRYLAIPLYCSAALTGYSRIQAKRHTLAQVLVAIALSETVNTMAYRSKWSQHYQGFFIDITESSVGFSFSLRF